MRFKILLCRYGIRVTLLLGVLAVLACSGCTRSPEAKSARFIEEGKQLLAKKDPARAILQFRNAVQATPKNAEAHYQLAQAYLAAGDLRTGVTSLRKALELDPKHEGAQLRLAGLMTNANDPAVLRDAQQRLRGLVQDAPANTDALHALALTELKLGQVSDAMQHLERAAANAPKELVFAVTLAQAKLQQKDVKGAENILRKALEDSPQSPDAAVILGRFYIAQNKNAEGEQLFQKALALNPGHVAALLNLATLQYQLGRKAEAQQSFKRLSASSDKSFRPIYANFLAQEGSWNEAIAEFERLANTDPDDRTARTRLVAAYQGAGRIPDAQKILNDALKKNPKDMDALLQRGELFLAVQKYPEADADLNSVVHMKADSPEAHYALAKLYQARGVPQRQRAELAEALRLDPFLLPARVDLAASLTGDKAAQAALDVLDAAPADQKNQVALLEQRNWAFLVQGKEAEARKGVELGLAAVRTPTLLLQDAVLKIQAKRYADARASLHEVLSKNPDAGGAYEILVASYRAQNELRAALEEIKAYSAQHPKSAGLHFLYGNLLLETGDKVQAKQEFTMAKNLRPNSGVPDLSLAQIDLLQANWKDARRELTSLLSAKGENPQAQQWLGMLEASSGDPTAAIKSFRKVIENQPDNAVALNNLAYLLSESGDQTQEPLKFAQRAVELDPKNPEFEDTLGWVLFRRGVYGVAVTHLERAMSMKVTALRQYHLAMAYHKAGQSARGRTALQAGLRMDPTLPEAKAARQLLGVQ